MLDLATTANTFGLQNNCYYCTVAALSNMTVQQFFHVSQIMQQDTATPQEILDLWAEAGIENVSYRTFAGGDDFDAAVLQIMPLNHGLGLFYLRVAGPGHMVAIKNLIDKIWWNYSHSKFYILWWTFIFLIIFCVINYFKWDKMQAVYSVMNKEQGKIVNPTILKRSLLFTFLYTSFIFFGL